MVLVVRVLFVFGGLINKILWEGLSFNLDNRWGCLSGSFIIFFNFWIIWDILLIFFRVGFDLVFGDWVVELVCCWGWFFFILLVFGDWIVKLFFCEVFFVWVWWEFFLIFFGMLFCFGMLFMFLDFILKEVLIFFFLVFFFRVFVSFIKFFIFNLKKLFIF